MNKKELAKAVIEYSIYFKILKEDINNPLLVQNIIDKLDDVIEVENFLSTFGKQKYFKMFKNDTDRENFIYFMKELQKVRNKFK